MVGYMYTSQSIHEARVAQLCMGPGLVWPRTGCGARAGCGQWRSVSVERPGT